VWKKHYKELLKVEKFRDKEINRKLKKRPTGLFGVVLCSKCRDLLFEETIKVKSG
jgi:ribosomal protein L34E